MKGKKSRIIKEISSLEREAVAEIQGRISCMEEIRHETRKNKGISDVQRESYLNYSKALALGLTRIKEVNVLAGQMIEPIIEAIKANPQLYGYDPIQDGYWQKRAPLFIDSLDKLLMLIVKDGFQTSDAKHHLVQAMICTSAMEKAEKRRLTIESKVQPFNNPLEKASQSLLMQIVGVLFGKRYQTLSKDEMTLYIEDELDFVDEMASYARDLGYCNLEWAITEEEYKAVQRLQNSQNEEFTNVMLVGNHSRGHIIRIPLRNIEYKKELKSPLSWFEAITSLDMSEELEMNLVWSESNSVGYGKEIIADVKEKTKDKEPNDIVIEKIIDPVSEFVSLHHAADADGYRRMISLFMIPAERYIVGAIAHHKEDEMYVKRTWDILKLKAGLKEKISQMIHQEGIQYVRIRSYQEGKLFEDMEAMN